MTTPKYADTVVKLTDEDSNAFNIVNVVMKAIRRDIGLAAAAEFQNMAFNCGSYDELLQLCMETVTVE